MPDPGSFVGKPHVPARLVFVRSKAWPEHPAGCMPCAWEHVPMLVLPWWFAVPYGRGRDLHMAVEREDPQEYVGFEKRFMP